MNEMSDTPGDLLDSEAIKFDDPLAAPQQDASGSQLDVIMGIPVVLQVVLGELKLPVSELYNLGPGSVLELDRRIGEPVDLLVNGQHFARGEIVVMDEAARTFGVTLTDITPRK